MTGLGEDIRGSMMGVVESVSSSEEGKAKDQDITTKGRAEIEQGLKQMRGGGATTGSAAGPESQTQAQKGGQLQQEPAKQGEPASAQVPIVPPPSQGAVGTETSESQQAGTEAQRQEPAGQIEKGKTEKGGQATQPGS